MSNVEFENFMKEQKYDKESIVCAKHRECEQSNSGFSNQRPGGSLGAPSRALVKLNYFFNRIPRKIYTTECLLTL